MRSVSAALVPAARFLAKLLWIIAKAIIALIACVVCLLLVSALTEELIEAVGLYDYAYDVAYGIHLGLVAAVIVTVSCKLFCWVSGKNWFAQAGTRPAYQRSDYAPESKKT